MKVVWRPMAEADREHIFDYIAQDTPSASRELDKQFSTSVSDSSGMIGNSLVSWYRNLS